MDESAAVRVCVQGRGAVGGQISTGKWAEESQGGGNIHGLGFSLVQSPVFLPVPLPFIPKQQNRPVGQKRQEGGREKEGEDGEVMCTLSGLPVGVALAICPWGKGKCKPC